MDALTTIRTLLAYSDGTNRKLFDAALPLTDDGLDQPFEMGLGTLRKTLGHIFVGEAVWLERWKGNADFRWGSVEVPHGPGEMLKRCDRVWYERDAFLATVTPEALNTEQPYLDSTAGMFTATLHEMILQGIVHSTHHRAQAVNMIRRLRGPIVDVDFMYARRRPVQR